MIFAGVLSPNPFITCLLPRALTNPLLMHSILAFSGSHLAYRLAEEAQGANSPSKDLNIANEALVKRIKAWAMDPLPDVASSRDTASLEARIFDWEPKRKEAECLRQTLYIYAALSLLGSSSPSDGLRKEVQQRIDSPIRLAIYLRNSPCSTNLPWAIFIAGSCKEDTKQREGLIYGLKNSRYQMQHLRVVQRGLQLLWADDDTHAYGPFGLRYVAQKHGLGLVIVYLNKGFIKLYLSFSFV
ncbi:hypothetical protein VCV18_009974 [Metarhizium anisopliae]